MFTKIVSQSSQCLVSKPSALLNSRISQRTLSNIPSKNFIRSFDSSSNPLLDKGNRLGHNYSLLSKYAQRNYFSTESKSWWKNISWKRDLEQHRADADANPQDAEKQAILMQCMISDLDKIARFESGKYAQNETTKAIYLDALKNTNTLDKLLIQNGSASISNPLQQVQIVSNPPTRFDRTKEMIGMASQIGILAMIGYVIYSLSDYGESEESDPVKKGHVLANKPKVRFADVKGIDEVKADLEEVVQYLKNPEKFTKLGAKLPKGVLLSGEPGTGKTLLARAVAGEAGVPFLYASGSSFDELYVGVGPKRVRQLFEDARSMAPCIVFIDELDAVGTSRKYSFGSNAKESTLNQLLTELDGFEQSEGIIIMGATNIPDALDPALVRPGRFDKQVFVFPPDIDGRKEILSLYLQKTKPAEDVNIERLAKGTTGFTGADLFNLINQSAIKAAIRGNTEVDMRTIEESRDDIIMGGKKRELFMSEEEKLMTAYHESGHTLVAIYSQGAHPVHKATIAPRGNALGVTSFLPEDIYSRSRKQMKASLKVAMGGRAAEELIYGDDGVNTGASNDFMNASNMARRMVTELGFSEKIGKVHHDGKKQISERQLELIDSEVKILIDNSYAEAKHILADHQKELHLLAKALLEHETLSVEEIKDVISGKTLPTPVQIPKKNKNVETIISSPPAPSDAKKPSPKKEKAVQTG